MHKGLSAYRPGSGIDAREVAATGAAASREGRDQPLRRSGVTLVDVAAASFWRMKSRTCG